MFKTVAEFWGSMFTAPTVTDDVVHRTHKATAEVQQAEALIDRARYLRHMALHELMALEEWNHGRVIETMPKE